MNVPGILSYSTGLAITKSLNFKGIQVQVISVAVYKTMGKQVDYFTHNSFISGKAS